MSTQMYAQKGQIMNEMFRPIQLAKVENMKAVEAKVKLVAPSHQLYSPGKDYKSIITPAIFQFTLFICSSSTQPFSFTTNLRGSDTSKRMQHPFWTGHLWQGSKLFGKKTVL